MPRKPRIHYTGAIYHVILRGNNRQKIFFDDVYWHKFYQLLADVTKKYDCEVHVFCLMSNHVHLIIQVHQIPLSRIIQSLASRYANWLYKRLQRVGHLFQGRFNALIVQNDSYILELCKYIHLNPVRAGIVDSAEQYRWSSHRCYLGLEDISWLTTEYILQILRDAYGMKDFNYKDFIGQDVDHKFKPDLEIKEDGDIIIQDKVQQESNENFTNYSAFNVSFDSIVKIVCRELSVNSYELALPSKERKIVAARALIAMYAQDCCCIKLSELAKLLDRSITTLSNAVCVVRKHRACNKQNDIFEKIERELFLISKSVNQYV
jgi:REP element-mobilizing transposase RayT